MNRSESGLPWAGVQVELLNRRRWRTRPELPTVLFEYLEIFHNRQRRHFALGMRSPVEYELRAALGAGRSLHPFPERFTPQW